MITFSLEGEKPAVTPSLSVISHFVQDATELSCLNYNQQAYIRTHMGKREALFLSFKVI
jgi:hypothetical protein